MKIIPNKSIMTSYIKSPYFKQVPISALLKLILNRSHITDCKVTYVVKMLLLLHVSE